MAIHIPGGKSPGATANSDSTTSTEGASTKLREPTCQALRFPGYSGDLAGLAQVRAAQDRFREAADLYQQAIGVVPMPVYVEALAGVQSRLGLLREAKKQYELVEFMGRLSSINKAVYNRELALYYPIDGIDPRKR